MFFFVMSLSYAHQGDTSLFIDHHQTPSRWTKYRPSLCLNCQSDCCRLPVEVTADDLLRMDLISVDQALGSLKKTYNHLRKQGIVISFRARTGIFTLAQRSNGDCQFLDKQRNCSIYFKRPQTCRNFPEIGPRPGFCPSREAKNPSASKPTTLEALSTPLIRR